MANENIFREVDEELRSERMRRMWRQFGPLIIGAAVLVVLLVAFNEGWRWYQRSQAANASELLYTAFNQAEAGDVTTAQATFDQLEASAVGGYPILARFREASLLAEAGDTAGAVAAYDALSTSATDTPLRELALVMAASNLVDTGTLADVEARVGAMAAGGGGLQNSARELLGLARYKAQDYAGAMEMFEAVLNDPLTDNQQRNRASFYLAQMLAEGHLSPEELDAQPVADALTNEPIADQPASN